MRRLIVLAAVALLAGCGSAPKKGLELRVSTHPFKLTLIENGKTLVAEDTDARLRYQLSSSGEQRFLTNVISSNDGIYTVATNEPGRTATVTVRQTRNGVHVSTVFHPSTGIAQVYDAFDASAKDHFLGGGERGGTVDLRGQVVPVAVSDTCSYAPVPYFASSAGWAVGLTTTNVSALAFPGSPGGTGGCAVAAAQQCSFPPLADRAEVCVTSDRLDETLYAGDFAQTLAAYDRFVPAVAPPEDERALIKWRDVYSDSAQVLEDISRLRAAGVPLGWVLVDNPWESCVGTLTFDRHRFIDPAALIARVHVLGVKFMLWVSPKTQCDVGYAPNELLGDPQGQDAIDLTQHRVVSIFEGRLRRLVALGIDGVKADRGDEVALGPRLQNLYPILYAQDVMRVVGARRAAIFRAATAGSHVPGIWAGDQEQTWAGLAQAIRSGETASMSGFPSWGSDVGGYDATGQLNGDLFARWAQLGAISPIMEVGGQGAASTPWTLGQTAMTALREAGVLHYELAPEFSALLARGEPVLRPLGYAFPDDPQAWTNDLELMVGPDLLAAPVTGPGETPSVYLPAGLWVDLHTGRTVKGPTVITRPTPLDVLPLYARAGAVIPFNLRTASSWWGVDELTHAGRAGYLASDGDGIDLHRQPHDVQLWVPASSRPASVTFAGKPVRWSWNPAPLPGVVVRVNGPTVRGNLVLHG